jgi:hypothetical protein
MWFLLFFATLSFWGLNGAGFQMRFIAPLIPAIYLMLHPLLDNARECQVRSIGILLLAIYGGMIGAVYLLSPNFDEIHSVFELIGWI